MEKILMTDRGLWHHYTCGGVPVNLLKQLIEAFLEKPHIGNILIVRIDNPERPENVNPTVWSENHKKNIMDSIDQEDASNYAVWFQIRDTSISAFKQKLADLGYEIELKTSSFTEVFKN